MSGSDVDALSSQEQAPAANHDGPGLSIKKRKKDGPKPVITMEGPPPQRPADADIAAGTGEADMHE
ncbi:hypothetical protein V8C35DRAFT_285193 [Trichoderma chlorosporum]